MVTDAIKHGIDCSVFTAQAGHVSRGIGSTPWARLTVTSTWCSALFPIPLAFESTGIIAALIAMIVVAAATIYTVELLMSQATATGMHDYETLSLAVGGWWYKVRPAFQ